MKRRKLLAALGLLGGGAALATGSGAFTSVEADRDVDVEIAGDQSAYVTITDTGNANDEYITTDTGQMGIDLTSGNSTSGGGSGVNTNAVTVIEDLFEVGNQGTQDVDVEVSPLTFVDTGNGNTLIVLVVPDSGFPSVTVSPGNTEIYSLVVDVYPGGTTSGTGIEISDTITVTAEAP
jgi:hypothetical protein